MDDFRKFFLSENEKNWCLENNVKVTYPGEASYPDEFYKFSHQPHFLFYLGQPIWKHSQMLSVVGSRTPQIPSLNWLDQILAELLTESKCVLVSGGARGIDQKVHQVAVRMGLPTVVFLPSGLMQMYPSNLLEWAQPILKAGGAIVSQFLPNASMRKHYFRERNRLIAAVSQMTLVVECRRRSGTLLTAKYALEMDKILGVMPTFPGESGMGGLDLLCDSPAVIIRDYLDLKLTLNNSAKVKHSKGNKANIGCPSGH